MFTRFSDEKYVEWAKQVKSRDCYRCQICGSSDRLHSHHKNSWNYFIEERYSIDNGVTLCNNCHLRFHMIYGKGYNTKFQFEEYKKIINIICNEAKKERK